MSRTLPRRNDDAPAVEISEDGTIYVSDVGRIEFQNTTVGRYGSRRAWFPEEILAIVAHRFGTEGNTEVEAKLLAILDAVAPVIPEPQAPEAASTI